MTDAPTIHLRDYTPPNWLIEHVSLTFHLSPHATRVRSKIRFRPNPATKSRAFFLDGKDLRLIGARIDGLPVSPKITPRGLSCAVPDGPFVWQAEVEIDPANNTSLEGLYMSGGMYCTQCEAEGFRKITFYPDRPDVMAPFDVRIEGDYPVLLSNGNPGAREDEIAEWHDPWPKPSYLFALVAGDLVAHRDEFRTMSGRDVALAVWVRRDDLDKCGFAMEALKRAMAWDEATYGREYDLDIFNIVAVSDFNMGAMENKGLNIFNSAAVLANPQSETDENFARVEGIIAHEYFHNWTGDRITCRDWFQLSLKEGLTVFRDQSYTADRRGADVKRIKDVETLRARQFREDSGPLAHPVRPQSYVEINNFYTATIYEKGAEVIRMLKSLVGDAAYRRALDLYFERYDGQACTIEDWLQVFEDTTGRDLSQFKRWYSQAGTPHLTLRETYENGTLTLHFSQHTPPTPGQAEKLPLVLPIKVGLLNPNGDEVVPTTLLEMTEAEQSFEFTGLSARPLASVLREFSAPVILHRDLDDSARALLLAHDTDAFNKWEAGRDMARASLVAMASVGADGADGADGNVKPDATYIGALAHLLRDDGLSPAFRARALDLPSQDEIALALHAAGQTPDPIAIWHALQHMRSAMAAHMADFLPELYAQHDVTGPYSSEAEPAGKRALQGAVLPLLARLDGGDAARAQFANAGNMTQQLSALATLTGIGQGTPELMAFYDQWHHDALVLDKWFGVQLLEAAPETGPQVARDLSRHPDFNWKNPNRFRALFGALAANPAVFHAPSGTCYRLLADWLIRLDPVNPQIAARMCGAFETWKRYDPARQALIRAQLERIAQAKGLSPNVSEMVGRILAG